MAGIVTWERSVAQRLPDGIHRNSNVYTVTDPWRVRAGSAIPKSSLVQRTTSYRSGRSEQDIISRQDDPNYVPSTRSEIADMLRRDKKRSSRNEYDNGHDFSTSKNSVSGGGTASWRNSAGTITYSGQFWPNTNDLPSGMGLHQFTSLAPESLDFFGTKAINMTIPTHPVASLATALAELRREGLPSLPGIQSFHGRKPSDLAGEYLNVEFGLKPLGSDIGKAMYAVSEAGKLLRQRQRDSGRIIRRSCTLGETSSSETWTKTLVNVRGSTLSLPHGYNGVQLSGIGFFLPSTEVLTETVTQTRSYKFSGGYTYHLPTDNSQWNKLLEFEAKANALLGTRITPEVLWNLAPWSWLSDWFGNIGDNISNATRFSEDGLVLRYGYIMCHTISTRTVTASGAIPANGGTGGSCSVTWTKESKTRKQATPFGFGLDPSSFTGRQWSILGALGMTKSDRVLRQSQ